MVTQENWICVTVKTIMEKVSEREDIRVNNPIIISSIEGNEGDATSCDDHCMNERQSGIILNGLTFGKNPR
jgi:hypothetical protein